ncbi:hypothetical protein V501_09859 [Pseudogymnoascus sp. VKM F-4519 (FW-2642)]|nr:hypothetical protein V501_09859 [Pseudogymnoascus sp. VKM F-4519 (FW-2642)]
MDDDDATKSQVLQTTLAEISARAGADADADPHHTAEECCPAGYKSAVPVPSATPRCPKSTTPSPTPQPTKPTPSHPPPNPPRPPPSRHHHTEASPIDHLARGGSTHTPPPQPPTTPSPAAEQSTHRTSTPYT